MRITLYGASCRTAPAKPGFAARDYGKVYFVKIKPSEDPNAVGCEVMAVEAPPSVARSAIAILTENKGKPVTCNADMGVITFGRDSHPTMDEITKAL